MQRSVLLSSFLSLLPFRQVSKSQTEGGGIMAFYLAGGKVFPTFPPGEHEVIYVIPEEYIGRGVHLFSIEDAVRLTWGPAGWNKEAIWEVHLPNPLCPEGAIMVPVRRLLSPEQLNALNAARQQGWQQSLETKVPNPSPVSGS